MNERLSSTREVRCWLSLAVLCLAAGLGSCGGGGGGAASGAPPAPGTAPPLISGFTPTSAAVGQSVTIEGLNFVAGATTVSFNGVAATGVSAAPTQISVTVPAGATSGRISVGTAGGTATSSSDFTVLANSTTPGIAWTTRHMSSPMGALAFGAGKFVTANSDIRSSTDLKIWTDRVGLANKDGVAWDGTQFVAVGGSFSVSTSPDGLAWTGRSLPMGIGDLGAVVGSGTKWVAVGANGGIASSPDGITWTNRGLGTGAFTRLGKVIWTGSLFVAAGESGLLATSPDGDIWTVRDLGTLDTIVGLGSSGSLIVASTFPNSGSQQAHYTSPDGVTWTKRGTGTAPILFDILVVGGVWVGSAANAMFHSSDGITWTQSSSTIDSILDWVVHDGSKFLAVGSGVALGSSGGEAYTSTDGLNWTLINPGERGWTGIARSPTGLMVSPGFERVQVSSNGIDWSYSRLVPLLSGGLDPIIDVVWYPALNSFVALAQVAANQRVYTSTDGLSWTPGVNVNFNGGLGASPTLLVNIANFNSGSLSTSPDGLTWTPRAIPATAGLTKAVWLVDRWVALGQNGTLMTSPDGLAWTLRTSNTTQTLRAAAVATGGLIVAVGAGGTILSSGDGGVTWTPRASQTVFTLNEVTWTGAEFVAIGNSGRVVRSTNGIDWTAPPTPYTANLFGTDPFNLRAAVWTGSRIVVVGDRNLVATSP